MTEKIFVPKLPIKFNEEGRYELFEISTKGKGLFLMVVPSHFINLFLGYHTMKYLLLEQYIKTILLGIPFGLFNVFSSYLA